MPLDATIEFPRADVDALFAQIDRAQKEVGASLGGAIRTATNRVALSMGTSTRVAPKYRTIKDTGDGSGVRKFDPKTGKFYRNKRFEVYNDKTRRPFDVWAKNMREAKRDKRVMLGRRGLAKLAWRKAAQGASAAAGFGVGATGMAARYYAGRHGKGDAVYRGDNPWSKMSNFLDYAGSALVGGPNTVDTAMSRAADAMAHIIDGKIKKKMGAK